MKPKFIFTAGFLLGLASACSPSADSAAFSTAGGSGSQSKPAPTLLGSTIGDNNALAATTGITKVVVATYGIVVTSNSGANVCSGSATINIMSNFTLDFPTAEIQCLSLTINLGAILAGDNLTGGLTTSNLSSDGKVLSVSQLANAQFSPPRPFLIGPVVQDPASYQGFTRDVQTSVTATDPQGNQSYNTTGSFHLQVDQTATTYANNDVGQAFNNVMHWEMTTSGFTSVPARLGLLFKKWDWYWNTNPVMIPKITIVGDLSDFISGGTSSNDALVGQVTIDLSVQSYSYGS